MQKFSIIIPTLNEAENIAPLLQRIASVVEGADSLPEIIFIDDGSTDGTSDQVSAYEGSLTVRLHERKGVKGLAGAVVTGARLAEYENLVIMDCDLSHPPETTPLLIRPLLSGEEEMVIGSRYTAGGSTPDWPLLRKLSSRLATLPAHFLTGVEDPLAGFFSVKKKLLAELDPKTDGFKIGFELLCKYGNDMRTAEVPIRFTDRSRGKSKMRLSILVHYFFQLLKGYGIEYQVALRPLALLLGCLAALFDAGLFGLLLNGHVDLSTSHIVSFLLTMHACFFLGIDCLMEEDGGCPSLLKCYRHLLFVTIPILFLRGGLLSAIQGQQTLQPTTLIMLALTSFFTWLLFVTTLQPSLRGSKTKKTFLPGLAVIVIIYTLVLRLIYLGTTELLQEEAYYWNYARHLSPGYLDHPPLVAVLIWLGTNIFGDSEAGVRLGTYCCWFFTAYFSYSLTRSMFNAKAAIYAVLLVATLPIFFGSALVMTPDAPLMTCWAATLYYLYQALCKDQKLSWIGAGVFFGFGLLSKYTIVLLAPATLLFMLFDPVSRRWLRSPFPYLAAIIALILFFPVIWWNWQNDWASFLFQSHGRIMDVSVFSTHELLASLVLLLTPVGFVTALYSLYPFKKKVYKDEDTASGMSSRKRFCLIMTLTPLLVFLFFSLTKEIKVNWTGPIWLVTIPFMAHSIMMLTADKKQSFSRLFTVGWPTTFFSLIFIYGAALHFLSIGLPGIPYPNNNILLGWDDLNMQVEETADRFEQINGKRPIVVGMDKYRIASGLSFYMNKDISGTKDNLPQATGRHIFGYESLMFRYWHPSRLFSQQDILALAPTKIGLNSNLFINKTLSIGDIKELSIQKQGKIVGTYYYRLLRGYTPAVPKEIALSDSNFSK